MEKLLSGLFKKKKVWIWFHSAPRLSAEFCRLVTSSGSVTVVLL